MTKYIVTHRWSHTPLLIRVINIINSKINGTPKSFYFPISKQHSILALANLLAHNLWLCYYVQVNLQRLKKSVASKWASKNLWGYHLFCCWWCILSFHCTFFLAISLFFFFTLPLALWPSLQIPNIYILLAYCF